MTIIRTIRSIYDEHLHELRNDKEKQFIYDVYEGTLGLNADMCDEDLDDYLSPRQIQWIEDITRNLFLS